jgi:hypothetical protein
VNALGWMHPAPRVAPLPGGRLSAFLSMGTRHSATWESGLRPVDLGLQGLLPSANQAWFQNQWVSARSRVPRAWIQ